MSLLKNSKAKKLKTMSKSHVGMDTKICPVTGKKHDVGILLDRRLQETLERENITGWELCPEVKEQLDKGFVALVACDPEKTTVTNGKVLPQNAWRTGEIMYIRREVAEGMFNMKLPAFVFAEQAVVLKLQEEHKDIIIEIEK